MALGTCRVQRISKSNLPLVLVTIRSHGTRIAVEGLIVACGRTLRRSALWRNLLFVIERALARELHPQATQLNRLVDESSHHVIGRLSNLGVGAKVVLCIESLGH